MLESLLSNRLGPATLWKKKLWHKYFPMSFKNTIFCRTPLVDASRNLNYFTHKNSFLSHCNCTKNKVSHKGFFPKNVVKSTVSCRFGHIYWRNLSWKLRFLCSVQFASVWENTCTNWHFLEITLKSIFFTKSFGVFWGWGNVMNNFDVFIKLNFFLLKIRFKISIYHLFVQLMHINQTF